MEINCGCQILFNRLKYHFFLQVPVYSHHYKKLYRLVLSGISIKFGSYSQGLTEWFPWCFSG